jgi:DNA-binding transcriptional regulator YiaG
MHGKDIVALRKALKLSQTELAERLGVPVAWVGEWERGLRFTTKKHHELLLRLAAAPDTPDEAEPA